MDRSKLPRRRLLVVGAAAVVVVVVVLVVLATNPLEANDAYGSIVAALVALGTAFTGIVLYLRHEEPQPPVDEAAEALVVELLQQWEPEIRHRRQRFGDSRVIPLSWKETDRDVAPDPASLLGGDTRLRSVHLKLDGRLDDNPDRAAEKIARAFTGQSLSRRLVVLGEPGAGKTFLAITLTVGLLREWAPGGQVPVFLSLSSWDPVETTLDDWIVRTLAQTYYGGRERTPRALLARRLLTPVLDGLDEMPEHVRRQAISRVNDTLDGDRPLVLTCRTAEYEDGLAGGAPVLLRAPVVEIRPLGPDDVVAHLRGEPRWAEVVRHVERHPDSPLSTALSTPLMLSLSTAAYRAKDPAELVEPGRFTHRHAVEDHLVDLLVDAVYPEEAPAGPWWRPKPWTAARARTWLTNLALHLHRHGERDIAWWRLAQRVLSPWTAAALGLLVGLPVWLLALVVQSASGYPFASDSGDPVSVLLNSPPLLGTLFGVVVGSLWLVGARRPPGRGLLTADRGGVGFGGGFSTGVLLVLTPGTPLLLAFQTRLGTGYVQITNVVALGAALFGVAVVAGLAVGLHELLLARSDRTSRASPEEFLRQDRRSALSAVVVASLVVGAFSVLAATLGAAVGGHVGQRVAVAVGLPTVVNVHLPPLDTHVPWSLEPGDRPALVAVSAVLAVLFAAALLTTRAWTRFVVARVVVAVDDLLPLRAMTFLEDARRRGLLRVADGSYQFWHVRLQERLVATADDDASSADEGAEPWFVVAGLTVLVLAAVVAVPVWAHEPEECRATGWEAVDDRVVRVVDDEDDSGCFAFLYPQEWQLLERSPGDAALLAELGSPPPPSTVEPVSMTVVGEFDALAPAQWHRALEGVVAARQASRYPQYLYFFYADTDGLRGTAAHEMTSMYYDVGARAVLVGNDRSLVDVDPDRPRRVLGAADRDLAALPEQYAAELVENWLRAGGPDRRLPPGALLDGISDGDCAAMRNVSGDPLEGRDTYDVRGVPLPESFFDQVESCGRVSLLVDQEQAEDLRERPEDVPLVIDVVHVSDESATIEPHCRALLGEDAHPESVATCAAALAVADSFRVTLAPVIER
ncbi:NACHT domain-containing NTPase [Saccharothrix sp. HUAS TT1]|uniref:NACHT domain-containing protein n=1 Tax=unclassified Saccharothrix TaxID=2593673 RepID=UPI00345C090F